LERVIGPASNEEAGPLGPAFFYFSISENTAGASIRLVLEMPSFCWSARNWLNCPDLFRGTLSVFQSEDLRCFARKTI
jgi:hypothetical protein